MSASLPGSGPLGYVAPGRIAVLEGPGAEARVRARAAPADPRPEREAVGRILERVRAEGDAALLALAKELDGVRPSSLLVDAARCAAALDALPGGTRRALERARRNIERFHAAQRREEPTVEVEPGVLAWREFRPLERVGIYVPGGRAAYPSSLLMAAVPARLAGCRSLVVCSPPRAGGLPAEPVLAAAALVEADVVFAAGGAGAIAALAYGTESVPRVDKVFGPGGRWTDAAKAAVAETVAVDLPAGPSEVVAWADREAPPAWVAAELLAQAEHGPDSLCVGILPDRGSAEAVARALADQLAATERGELAAESLAASALLVAPDDGTALAWVEALAPEHLVLLRSDARALAARVSSAGSVFLGLHTPVAAGDYAAGPNHILPTGGRARGRGGLGLEDFGRWVQFLEVRPAGLRRLGPAVEAMAVWEGLPAHAASVRIRLAGAGTAGTSAAQGEDEEGHEGAEGNGACLPAPAGLLRPGVERLRAYAGARRPPDAGGLALLDANENAFGTPAPDVDPALHRYPDPSYRALRERLGAAMGVPPEAVWPTNGSDEGLDLLIRAAVGPGQAVVLPVPTYGVYEGRARVAGAAVRTVPLDARFNLDVEATARAGRGARLVILCSPNNPTGTLLSEERVLALARALSCLVAVDEAYTEFAGDGSLAPRATEIPNLVVVRTLSKAWGLAGARVGYLVARPDLVRRIAAVGLPYPVSRPAERAALLALERAEEVRARRDRIVAERERLARALARLGVPALPSRANFLLFTVRDPAGVRRTLAEEHGVLVRDRSGLPRLGGGLRVSVGTPEENDRFLGALAALLGRAGAGNSSGASASPGTATGEAGGVAACS